MQKESIKTLNDGTRIRNEITLNPYSEVGNELRVISFAHIPPNSKSLCRWAASNKMK